MVGVAGNVEGVFDFVFDSITSLSLNGVSVNICVSYNARAHRQALSFSTSLSFSNWNYVQRKEIFFPTVLTSEEKKRRERKASERIRTLI